MNFIEENYYECLRFYKKNRKFFLIATLIFLFTTIVGFAFPIFFREKIIELILQMTTLIEGKTTFEIISLIFFNNIKAAFFSLVFGIGFGILPLFAAVSNGYLLGFVSREVVEAKGALVLWQLFPHGIFELPAMLFSIGIGFKIASDIFLKNSKENLLDDLNNGLRFFVFVIIPLLIIAAIIEGTLIGLSM